MQALLLPALSSESFTDLDSFLANAFSLFVWLAISILLYASILRSCGNLRLEAHEKRDRDEPLMPQSTQELRRNYPAALQVLEYLPTGILPSKQKGCISKPMNTLFRKACVVSLDIKLNAE